MCSLCLKQPFENVGLLSMPLKINCAEWVSVYQVLISVKSEFSLQFYGRDFGFGEALASPKLHRVQHTLCGTLQFKLHPNGVF